MKNKEKLTSSLFLSLIVPFIILTVFLWFQISENIDLGHYELLVRHWDLFLIYAAYMCIVGAAAGFYNNNKK